MAEYHSSSHRIFSVIFFNECFTETVCLATEMPFCGFFLIIFFLEYIKATETYLKKYYLGFAYVA